MLFGNRLITRHQFKMHMRAGRPTSVAGKRYDHAGFHQITRLYSNKRVMPIERAVSICMFDNDCGTITVTLSRRNNPPFANGTNRSPDRNGNIDPAVENKFATAEWIYPPSDTGGYDPVLNRQI
ncbi:hypothetical protein JN12_01540 [Geobacter argillaceus]|uniref:Uncharacterized protein n=1 Tax=Geobacter argillaceus TaxID=345631 RepID=A0A562VP99_9BACT|nr:hypothetical protein JN12_01540 [Geobacter argillaceus]